MKSAHAYSSGGADEQLERYSKSLVKSRKVHLKPEVSPTPGNKYVSGKFSYGIWDIEYKYRENGVITYDPKLNMGRVKQYLGAIVLVIGSVTLMAIAGVAAPGVVGGAAAGLAEICLQ